MKKDKYVEMLSEYKTIYHFKDADMRSEVLRNFITRLILDYKVETYPLIFMSSILLLVAVLVVNQLLLHLGNKLNIIVVIALVVLSIIWASKIIKASRVKSFTDKRDALCTDISNTKEKVMLSADEKELQKSFYTYLFIDIRKLKDIKDTIHDKSVVLADRMEILKDYINRANDIFKMVNVQELVLPEQGITLDYDLIEFIKTNLITLTEIGEYKADLMKHRDMIFE